MIRLLLVFLTRAAVGDTEAPDLYLEGFKVDSWAEHARQHEPFTMADREIEQRVLGFALWFREPTAPPVPAFVGRRGIRATVEELTTTLQGRVTFHYGFQMECAKRAKPVKT